MSLLFPSSSVQQEAVIVLDVYASWGKKTEAPEGHSPPPPFHRRIVKVAPGRSVSEFKWCEGGQETSLEICGCQRDEDSKVNISCWAPHSRMDLLLYGHTAGFIYFFFLPRTNCQFRKMSIAVWVLITDMCIIERMFFLERREGTAYKRQWLPLSICHYEA